MGAWLWWTVRRVIWSLLPLPFLPASRDRVLAVRAATLIDRWLPKGHPETWNTRQRRRAMWTRDRAAWILARHTMPVHMLRALMQARDPDRIAQSKRAEAELHAELDAGRAKTTPA